MWLTTIITLSVLVTTQPEYDGTLWRVYPGNQRYFYKNANAAVAMTIPKTPLPQAKPERNTASFPVEVGPAKKSPARSSLEASLVQGLKKLVYNKQLNQKAKKTRATIPKTPLPATSQKEIVIKYNTNIFRLTANQKKEIASHLNEYKRANRIHIDGYADMTGSARYNLILTQKRAKEVEKVLIALGIDRKKIVTRGLGQTNILPRGQNSRRTEIWPENDQAKK